MDLEAKLYREGFVISSFSKRLNAFMIDELIVFLFVIGFFYNSFLQTNGSLVQIVSILNYFIISVVVSKILYHTIFIVLYGKTIGKMVAKIRVVDIYYLDNPDFKNSFLRAFIRIFSESLFYFGFLFALTNPFIQTIHDKLAKVVVVNG